MANRPNWREFYLTLQQVGPELLDGVDPGLESWVSDQSSDSDAFYSDSLCFTLEECWEEDPKKAIQETLKVWVENVRQHLNEILGPRSIIPWEELGGTKKEKAELKCSIKSIRLNIDQEIIAELLEAAESEAAQ
mgnify:CR=1 FL=1